MSMTRNGVIVFGNFISCFIIFEKNYALFLSESTEEDEGNKGIDYTTIRIILV